MLPAGRDIVDFKPLIGEETTKVELKGMRMIIMNGTSFMLRFFEARCLSSGLQACTYDKAEVLVA